jgi:hypothetical protein
MFVFAAGTNHTGGSNSTHVDGYVRKYGQGSFILPVGDNSLYRPVTIGGMSLATDTVTAAYYNANPTTAITSRIEGGNFPALPSGAPFSSATFNSTLTRVSTTEYWDIDGVAITTINLPWGSASGISTLTDATLSKLTIAGYRLNQCCGLNTHDRLNHHQYRNHAEHIQCIYIWKIALNFRH